MKNSARTIVFYLPQFHPIPENDAWWGKGFTEWTNVRKAEPRFPGHYQPHVPGELGYYDLRDPDVRKAQAELAKAHGIHGFCYYHYWFNGKTLLEQPFNEVLQSGEPGFPFCLCWANENWTRTWDGKGHEILMTQKYSHEDDLAHINSLIPAFRDERYIRVNGKPLFIVYQSQIFPNPHRTVEIWREAMHKAGIGDIYLVQVENNVNRREQTPESIGFDAAIEFAPYWRRVGPKVSDSVSLYEEWKDTEPQIYDYESCMLAMLGRPKPEYKRFRGIFPAWDNSARKKNEALLFQNSSPEKYAFWLSQIARYTLENFGGDERLLFVNAWNEWGEGCHLEPDEKYGHAYLEATKFALRLAEDCYRATAGIQPSVGNMPFNAEKWYSHLAGSYRDRDDLTAEELNLLTAFSSYSMFAMYPMVEKAIRAQVDSFVYPKATMAVDLLDSVSCKITAYLKKIQTILFK
jgi:hypothetical protein